VLSHSETSCLRYNVTSFGKTDMFLFTERENLKVSVKFLFPITISSLQNAVVEVAFSLNSNESFGVPFYCVIVMEYGL